MIRADAKHAEQEASVCCSEMFDDRPLALTVVSLFAFTNESHIRIAANG